MIIGTCSNCGGPVKVAKEREVVLGFSDFEPAECLICGGKAEYGPRILTTGGGDPEVAHKDRQRRQREAMETLRNIRGF